ncbi:imidazole glycerol phosphate synthase subunit HisF [Altererythrobacter sp. MF3-039]|uniref:imidazole glycerol phosphate synthase subunit HisF n=1 Tax=Altererythrobacter sp. MF3-039 TaxID=3252901 RepID=UPI00390C76CA
MRNLRLIARLDVKMDWLIKGVQMEGWRKVGDPAEFAARYAELGADELLFMDVVASLYQRNSLHDIVQRVAGQVFVPMTVGGGIKSADDAKQLLDRGADKVAINTAATENPTILTEISDRYGAQATVLSIEAMEQSPRNWTAMTDNGRNHTGRDVVAWAKEGEERGAGEIILTSIGVEGLGKGFDIELVQQVVDAVRIPVVAAGGLGGPEHILELVDQTDASAAATAQALHWGKTEFDALRAASAESGCYVRPLAA